jgi:hypothetical protein
LMEQQREREARSRTAARIIAEEQRRQRDHNRIVRAWERENTRRHFRNRSRMG